MAKRRQSFESWREEPPTKRAKYNAETQSQLHIKMDIDMDCIQSQENDDYCLFRHQSWNASKDFAYKQILSHLVSRNELSVRVTAVEFVPFLLKTLTVDEGFHSFLVLWNSSNIDDSTVCHTELIECMTSLIECMTSLEVQRRHPTLMQMVRCCIHSVVRVWLRTPGCDLWIKVLQQSSDMTRSLDNSFGMLWPLLAQTATSSESLEKMLAILKSYVLLGGDRFLLSHGTRIQAALSHLLPVITPMDKALSVMCDVLCVFIQMHPFISVQFLSDVIAQLAHTFITEVGREQDLQCPQSMLNVRMLSKLRVEAYMFFFNRLILANTDEMLKVLQNTNRKNKLFAVMFAMKERVKQWYKQKVVVLGLLKVLQKASGNQEQVSSAISQALPWFLQVIRAHEIEILEITEDLFAAEEGEDDQKAAELCNETDRMRHLIRKDIVSNTFMIQALQQGPAFQTIGRTANDYEYCMQKYNAYLKSKVDNINKL